MLSKLLGRYGAGVSYMVKKYDISKFWYAAKYSPPSFYLGRPSGKIVVNEISHDLVEVFSNSEDTNDYNILKSDFPGKLIILLHIFIT